MADTQHESQNQPQPQLQPQTQSQSEVEPESNTVVVIPNPSKEKRIGNYIIEKTLGKGTFGKVKLATHIITNEKVAIKILEKDKIVDVADVERVTREIHILKLIRHPNIIQLYEIIESPKYLFLVMEFCAKGELFDYIVSKKRMDESEACKVFDQIISGIEYIHKMRIVHRDLKLENLLLDYDGAVRVVDFGLSNTYKQAERLKTACGSPCYAAPEMIEGKEPYEPIMVDIWSAGVILYAMVCGYLPFEDPDTPKLYKKILSGEYSTPSHLSFELKDFLSQVLTVDPKKRIRPIEMKSHPWWKKYALNYYPEGLIVGYHKIPVDFKVLKEVKVEFGLDIDSMQQCLEANRHNNLTTTYYLQMKKFLRNGGVSKADPSCNEFDREAIEPNSREGAGEDGEGGKGRGRGISLRASDLINITSAGDGSREGSPPYKEKRSKSYYITGGKTGGVGNIINSNSNKQQQQQQYNNRSRGQYQSQKHPRASHQDKHNEKSHYIHHNKFVNDNDNYNECEEVENINHNIGGYDVAADNSIMNNNNPNPNLKKTKQHKQNDDNSFHHGQQHFYDRPNSHKKKSQRKRSRNKSSSKSKVKNNKSMSTTMMNHLHHNQQQHNNFTTGTIFDQNYQIEKSIGIGIGGYHHNQHHQQQHNHSSNNRNSINYNRPYTANKVNFLFIEKIEISRSNSKKKKSPLKKSQRRNSKNEAGVDFSSSNEILSGEGEIQRRAISSQKVGGNSKKNQKKSTHHQHSFMIGVDSGHDWPLEPKYKRDKEKDNNNNADNSMMAMNMTSQTTAAASTGGKIRNALRRR